jgi:hypothetical protein
MLPIRVDEANGLKLFNTRVADGTVLLTLEQARGIAHYGCGAVLDNLLADAALARVVEHEQFDAVRLGDAGEPVERVEIDGCEVAEGLGVAATVIDDRPGATGEIDLGQTAGARSIAVDERRGSASSMARRCQDRH